MSTDYVLHVSRIDAGIALLQTQDFNVIEFPSLLLPENTLAGTIVNISITRNVDAEREKLETFMQLQNRIFEMYGRPPVSPVVSIVNRWMQNYVLLSIQFEQRGTAIERVDIYIDDGRFSGTMITPAHGDWSRVKLSDLPVVGQSFAKMRVEVVTSAGVLVCSPLDIAPSAECLASDFIICVLGFAAEETASLESAVRRVGAQFHQSLSFECTHLILGTIDDNQVDVERARVWNIPVVTASWIYACLDLERVEPIAGEYLRLPQ